MKTTFLIFSLAFALHAQVQTGQSVGGVSRVAFGDSGSVDAFQRLRISQPLTLLNSVFQYDKQPLIWEEAASGGASAATHDFASSSVNMTLGTTNGHRIVRQTHQYARYQPGKSQVIFMTALVAPALNTKHRLGQFDDDNGLFFEAFGDLQYTVLPRRRTERRPAPRRPGFRS